MASEMALEDRPGIDARAYNVGTQEATSVNTLATLLEEIAGVHRGRVHRDARPGDVRRNTLDTARIRALGWVPARSLREGLASTFHHIRSGRAKAGAA